MLLPQHSALAPADSLRSCSFPRWLLAQPHTVPGGWCGLRPPARRACGLAKQAPGEPWGFWRKGDCDALSASAPRSERCSLCVCQGAGALRPQTQGRVSPFGPDSPSGDHFWQPTEQGAGPACQRRAPGCLLGVHVWACGGVCLPGQAGERLGVELGLQAYVPAKASGFLAPWRPPPPWGLGGTIDN